MKFMTVILSLVLLVAGAQAADIHVPGDAPTIPAAFALAQNGDTIIVGKGTWVGGVSFMGKAVTLVAERGHGMTTIDGGGAEYAVVMALATGTATLDGFTVIGGTAGRVRMMGNGATIARRCKILGGDGVGVNALFGDGAVTVEDCLVQGNTGGGVTADGSLFSWKDIRRCLIKDNGSHTLGMGGGVAGKIAVGGVRVLDCLLVGNVANLGGGAMGLSSTEGSVFLDNHAIVGGGAYYDRSFDPGFYVGVDGAAFLDNSAPKGGGVYLAFWTFAASGHHVVTDCVFAGNTDDEGNYGVLSLPDNALANGYTDVTSCTVFGDRIYSLHTLTLRDSIVRGGRGLLEAETALIATYSNVEGGASGTGNFDADPLFVDAAHDVFALRPGSPCVDAGSPSSPLDPDGSIADVGALPLAPFASAGSPTFGQFGLPGLSGTGTLEGGSPVQLHLERARPAATAILIIGLPGLFAPLKGGVLVPTPQIMFGGLLVNAQGEITLSASMPGGLPAGLLAWTQFWIADSAAATGVSSSNGLGLVGP